MFLLQRKLSNVLPTTLTLKQEYIRSSMGYGYIYWLYSSFWHQYDTLSHTTVHWIGHLHVTSWKKTKRCTFLVQTHSWKPSAWSQKCNGYKHTVHTATMAIGLTYLGYDLRTFQAEAMDKRCKHLEHKYELGFTLNHGLHVATDTPVGGKAEQAPCTSVACA